MHWEAQYEDGRILSQGDLSHVNLPTIGLSEFSLVDGDDNTVVLIHMHPGEKPLFRERVTLGALSGAEKIAYIIGKNGQIPSLLLVQEDKTIEAIPLSDIVLDGRELLEPITN